MLSSLVVSTYIHWRNYEVAVLRRPYPNNLVLKIFCISVGA